MNIVFYLHDEKDPVVLEKRLRWLGERYHFISSEEIREFYYGGKKLKNACHLTVDDGWLSTYQVVFPLLKKYRIPASIFVSPKMCLDDGNFWYMESKRYDGNELKTIMIRHKYFSSGIERFPVDLLFKEMKIDEVFAVLQEYRKLHHIAPSGRGVVNMDELLEMDRSGLIEIGAHTMTHPILANEETFRTEKEIKESISVLSEFLSKKVTTFAYPNGLSGLDFGDREIEFIKSCGIELAYSVNPASMDTRNNPLAIPRIGSCTRLRLGRIGLALPSLHGQAAIRKAIKKYRI